MPRDPTPRPQAGPASSERARQGSDGGGSDERPERVDLRAGRADADALGNQFGLVFLELPVGIVSPAERLAAIRATSQELKQSPDAAVTIAVLAALGLLPGELERLGTEFFSRKASLVVTNVPGPRSRLHLAGHEIDRIMFNVPHPASLGLGVSILSYAGEVRVGARADVAVMPDPAAFVATFGAEVAAL